MLPLFITGTHNSDAKIILPLLINESIQQPSHLQQMIKTAATFLILLLTLMNQAACHCTPHGMRLFYGEVLTNPASSDLAVLNFDTHKPCESSFVRLHTAQQQANLPCSTQKLVTSDKMKHYTTYIHRCPLLGIEFDQQFNYTAFGWSGLSTDRLDETPLSWTEVTLKDPRPADREFTFVTLGDWGPIRKRLGEYTPVVPYMKSEIKAQEVDLVVIMGDIAYDLDSNNGDQYQDFMEQMEEVSHKTPVILVPGNLEHYSPDDQLLMNQAFVRYGLDEDRACGLYIGNSYLVIFDPYNIVYGMEDNTLKTLKDQLEKSKRTERFLWACSHYPLYCSGTSTCPKNYETLINHFDLLHQYGASFYIGAHAHSYQRLLPYHLDRSFAEVEQPYRSDQGYMIAFVEGVAGNDQKIVTELAEKREQTAFYTVGETGFSVLFSRKDSMRYDHFSTKRNGYVDTMTLMKAHNQVKTVLNLSTQ